MPKPTSDAEKKAAHQVPVRFVFLCFDGHHEVALQHALPVIRRDVPGIVIRTHVATKWVKDEKALQSCLEDIARADFIFASMLALEEHFQPILPALKARSQDCDAVMVTMSSAELMKFTRLGHFRMDGKQTGVLSLLDHLRGKRGNESKNGGNAGAQQMSMLRKLPKLLRFIPGTAQDVRAYFLAVQYWLACSDQNLANLVRFMVSRYARGERKFLHNAFKVDAPLEYPDVGLYHPKLEHQITDRIKDLPLPHGKAKGRVGLLLLRSYVLAGDVGHYAGVIHALEARGLDVIPAFAGGLDGRPAIEAFFMRDGEVQVDAVVSLTGFSLVGGPAYNDARSAERILKQLDVPYIAALPVEFQTINQWENSEQGLTPVEATMMVAIPELDGSFGPIVFGGREDGDAATNTHEMLPQQERAEMLAARVEKLVALRRTKRHERKIAIVIFNFPPNAGNTGTAAYLSVFRSLYATLKAMHEEGYQVELPASEDELRERIVNGNAKKFGAHANVFTRIPTDDHVRREPYLSEIETQWGSAPGKQQSDGSSIFVLGEQFGNVFVGVQPSFGYEGDPFRLLFSKGFTPTHAFTAFYRYLREDFGAHAVLHFGTHGALEFMPGKQVGMSATCWPDRLIKDLPNYYLYASNNPSEGTIAKRRSGATLISYMTPPIANAGLYKGLIDLKSELNHWRQLPPDAADERQAQAVSIQALAADLNMADAEPLWTPEEQDQHLSHLADEILEVEYTLIPYGLHVVGEPANVEERADLLVSIAESMHDLKLPLEIGQLLASGANAEGALKEAGMEASEANLKIFNSLVGINGQLLQETEIPAIIRALDGRYLSPAPGGDILRTPEILPTGRNLHGFDPFRMPSPFAVKDGARQAEKLITRHLKDCGSYPETIAIVLWGTDNLKTEGAPIGQVLHLLGARPRFDNYGRLTGAELIELAELGRPRIDVVSNLSGIFRDLLPLQIRLLADATLQAAMANEPLEQNFIRKHALAYQQEHGVDLETAALRVFSNADGAYGANVNNLVDSSNWDQDQELVDTFISRKGFAYGKDGQPVEQRELMTDMLGKIDFAYQNLDSVELGITTIDHYFDNLGGIAKAAALTRDKDIPVYVGDQSKGEGVIRTLSEQVALETRTRMLNPKWYEGMLKHGYEGVRQIEAHVTNTFGWSATTGQVAPWVYQELSETFVLDDEMRKRLSQLNPTASLKMANRLMEAYERNYWAPDEDTLEALRRATDDLEDRLEGVHDESAS